MKKHFLALIMSLFVLVSYANSGPVIEVTKNENKIENAVKAVDFQVVVDQFVQVQIQTLEATDIGIRKEKSIDTIFVFKNLFTNPIGFAEFNYITFIRLNYNGTWRSLRDNNYFKNCLYPDNIDSGMRQKTC